MRYKIAVCDDDSADREFLLSLVHLWARENRWEIQLDDFPSAEAFLFHYVEEPDYDILLLDIEMQKMDGVTMAKAVRAENETVQIIFVTGYSEYIAEGYEVAALHYLMKPLAQEKLFAVLERAVQKLKKNERTLVLERMGEVIRIPFFEIRNLEAQQNYVTVHGKQEVSVKKPLGEVAGQLDERFFRMGRSYVVNLAYVQKATKTEVYLTDGSILPLPRGQYEAFHRALIDQS